MGDVGVPRLTAERLEEIARRTFEVYDIGAGVDTRDLIHDLKLERERAERLERALRTAIEWHERGDDSYAFDVLHEVLAEQGKEPECRHRGLPESGFFRHGDKATCSDCGKKFVRIHDEAEGDFWLAEQEKEQR